MSERKKPTGTGEAADSPSRQPHRLDPLMKTPYSKAKFGPRYSHAERVYRNGGKHPDFESEEAKVKATEKADTSTGEALVPAAG